MNDASSIGKAFPVVGSCDVLSKRSNARCIARFHRFRNSVDSKATPHEKIAVLVQCLTYRIDLVVILASRKGKEFRLKFCEPSGVPWKKNLSSFNLYRGYGHTNLLIPFRLVPV